MNPAICTLVGFIRLCPSNGQTSSAPAGEQGAGGRPTSRDLAVRAGSAMPSLTRQALSHARIGVFDLNHFFGMPAQSHCPGAGRKVVGGCTPQTDRCRCGNKPRRGTRRWFTCVRPWWMPQACWSGTSGFPTCSTVAEARWFVDVYISNLFGDGKSGYDREGDYWWACDVGEEVKLHRYTVEI
jgi:hypothetical protein